MNSNKVYFLLFILGVITLSCKDNSEPIVITPNDFHASVDKVVEVMVHDIFSPPVASRVFAYPNIAAYEIIAQNNAEYNTLNNQITHLTKIPKSDKTKNINYHLAALIAHIEVSKQLIFSEQKIETFQDSLYQIWQSKNTTEFEASKNYALKVSKFIKDWMNNDNYNQTRTMPKFDVDPEPPGHHFYPM